MRALLITGAGRAFSSGADLKAGFDAADDGLPDIRKELDIYHPIIAALRGLDKPVVAAVNGPAVGIGASLALSCDLILLAESAYLGLGFVNIGLMPDGGSTLFVPAAPARPRVPNALLGERWAQNRRRLGPRQLRSSDERDGRGRLLARELAPPTRSYALEAPRSTGCSTRPRGPARPRSRAAARAGAHPGFPGRRDGIRGEA